MALFGHGHSHGRVEESKPLKEFTYLSGMEEGDSIAEKTTLTLSSVGDPPPKYTSHCPSVATSETDQVNASLTHINGKIRWGTFPRNPPYPLLRVW